MSFDVIYHDKVKKDIAVIGNNIKQLLKKAIEQKLTTAPQVYGKPLRHTLKNLWSLRVGDYRIIYQIKEKTVLILKIGHRKEVYL